MHIADGILEAEIAVAGFGGSIGLIIYSLKNSKTRENFFREVPKISVITAALFIASLLSIPVGPTTVHFSFVGLAGILLGPMAVLAVSIALIMQLILFSHGGFSTLGVNIFNFALAALAAHYIFKFNYIPFLQNTNNKIKAFLSAALATLLKIIGTSLALYMSGFPAFVGLSLTAVHVPIIIAEGILTALITVTLLKKRKELFQNEQAAGNR